MMDIQIFNAEKADGLEEKVRSNRITIASTIKSSVENPETLVGLKNMMLSVANSNYGQKDLFYKRAVLASIGWNANDDVFEPVESWNARNTVEDKQLNLNHDEMKIVGHMTKAYIVDSFGNVVGDDTPTENIPDKFDIVNEFVLYKIWANEDRQNEINSLIEEIENGEWYVSMECYFPSFDYALIDSNGNQKTVARSEDTAFLTKHLRAYGGSGEYQGFKVGRILRNFFFSGQGIVKVPANNRSVIFNVNDIKPFKSQGSLVIRDKKMDLEKEVAELKAKLEAKDAELLAAKSAETQKQVADLTKEVEALKASNASLNEVVKTKDNAIAELTEEAKKANERAAQAESKCDDMEKMNKKTARKGKLASAGVAESELDATVEKWDVLNDAQFDDIVAMFAAKLAATSTANKVEAEVTEVAKIEEAVIEEKPALTIATDTSNRIADLGKALLESGALRFSAKAQKNLNK